MRERVSRPRRREDSLDEGSQGDGAQTMGRFSQEVSPREMLQGFDLWIHGVLGGDRAHRFIKNSSRFISTLATEVQAAASVASKSAGSAPMGSVAMRLALAVSV